MTKKIQLTKTRSKWGELKLPIGKYIGEIIDGKSGAYGQIYYFNGDRYEGELKNAHPQGYGEMQYKNGDVYCGHFDDGIRHGSGVKTYRGIDGYVGEFHRGKEHGFGIYEQFKNGNFHPYIVKYSKGTRKHMTPIAPSHPSARKALASIHELDAEMDI